MEKILKPTRIYNEIPEIQRKYRDSLLGICHVTGGGIVEKSSKNFALRIDILFKRLGISRYLQMDPKRIKDDKRRDAESVQLWVWYALCIQKRHNNHRRRI